ncbi:hypothetical protein U5801_29485, partial [Lamprobacter modestohalophilus]|uniref:hypothetical protein n=1 Tax=Lamprobacter modestohalophilus TaxID=1064514 RepID=UPI002ADEF4A8
RLTLVVIARNAALAHSHTPWNLILDADERLAAVTGLFLCAGGSVARLGDSQPRAGGAGDPTGG